MQVEHGREVAVPRLAVPRAVAVLVEVTGHEDGDEARQLRHQAPLLLGHGDRVVEDEEQVDGPRPRGPRVVQSPAVQSPAVRSPGVTRPTLRRGVAPLEAAVALVAARRRQRDEARDAAPERRCLGSQGQSARRVVRLAGSFGAPCLQRAASVRSSRARCASSDSRAMARVTVERASSP